MRLCSRCREDSISDAGLPESVGWMMYKFASVYCSVAVASFIGTVCAVLVARMLTVRLKCPITIFMISGYHYTGAGSGHLFYGVLSGDKSVCNGCCERDRSNKVALELCLELSALYLFREKCSRKNTGLKERLQNNRKMERGIR